MKKQSFHSTPFIYILHTIVDGSHYFDEPQKQTRLIFVDFGKKNHSIVDQTVVIKNPINLAKSYLCIGGWRFQDLFIIF